MSGAVLIAQRTIEDDLVLVDFAELADIGQHVAGANLSHAALRVLDNGRARGLSGSEVGDAGSGITGSGCT